MATSALEANTLLGGNSSRLFDGSPALALQHWTIPFSRSVLVADYRAIIVDAGAGSVIKVGYINGDTSANDADYFYQYKYTSDGNVIDTAFDGAGGLAFSLNADQKMIVEGSIIRSPGGVLITVQGGEVESAGVLTTQAGFVRYLGAAPPNINGFGFSGSVAGCIKTTSFCRIGEIGML